ncbi:MAG: hypothetical protein AB7P12_00735 [Alphaproteobacteria bacterium]
MGVFDHAVDVCFQTFGIPASYTPPGGPAVAVTVIAARGAVADSGLVRAGFRLDPAAQATALTVDVRRAEIAAPVTGATLTIEGRVYPVRSVGELDPERLVWPLVLGKPVEG